MRPGSIHPHRDAWLRLEAALVWRYGHDRTRLILAAKDAETNTDIARWRRLGEKVGAT